VKLLRRSSSSGHDAGDIHDSDEGKSRVAIDDRNKIVREAILRERHNFAGRGNFIAAEVAATWVGERSSIG